MPMHLHFLPHGGSIVGQVHELTLFFFFNEQQLL